MKDFLNNIEGSLHNDLSDFYEFVTDKKNVSQYAAGIIGGNEVTITRARLYTECNNELHMALRDATIEFLKTNGFHDEIYVKYVDDAIRFTSMRKFSFDGFNNESVGDFQFDFKSLSENNYAVTPQEFPSDGRPKYRYRFYYVKSALSELDYAIRQWVYKGLPSTSRRDNDISVSKLNTGGNDAQVKYNLGKFFHQVNMTVLKKSYELLE